MSEHFGDFIARLTDNARTSLQHAESIARSQASSYIGTEHMLLGVLAQGSSVGAKMLADAGVTLDRAEMTLPDSASSKLLTGDVKILSETAMLTLKMAYDHARELNQEYLGTEHILYSILRQRSARGTVMLREMHADVDAIIDELESFFDRQQNEYNANTFDSATASSQSRQGILSVYGTDLTDQAKKHQLDSVIGRDRETERMVTILSRRTKNNPVLIGDPGVGKTAIVEGLAQRIYTEDVPQHLLDKRVVQLDLAAMVAGTKYRGEFEDRLKKVIAEVKKQANVILFIDELHLLVGAGSAEGSMDAANILKPALARSEVHVIGATTFDEYRKHIEKDAALERRFQSIVVKEPSSKDTTAILKGLRRHFETHHGVKLSDEVLEMTVNMSDRYVSDRFRPDKAIDVLDEAAALARVSTQSRPSRLRDYTRQIKQLNESMEEAVSSQDYERAALYKMRISRLNEKSEAIIAKQQSSNAITLTENHIAKSIALMTGIPVEKVRASERKALKNLEKDLSKFVIGQSEAVTSVAKAIRRSRSGVASGKRPIGSFVFMGPTGVGKTELARVLAREVFGSEEALIKIDMSEFSEKHTSSRLVGAPAGYVGYDDGGKLTDKIRRQPYSVVLFDEIEKAHRDVFQLLLQLLEDGSLTDAKGRRVDFTNTIVILTSNLGSDEMMRESSLGFHVKSSADRANLLAKHQINAKAARKELSKFMRPELINRFDDIITFNALTRIEVRKILNNLLDDLAERLVRQGLGLTVTSSAKRWLIDGNFDAKNGARPLRRAIEEHIEHAIAEGVLDDRFERGDIIEVSVKSGEVHTEVKRETASIQNA